MRSYLTAIAIILYFLWLAIDACIEQNTGIALFAGLVIGAFVVLLIWSIHMDLELKRLERERERIVTEMQNMSQDLDAALNKSLNRNGPSFLGMGVKKSME